MGQGSKSVICDFLVTSKKHQWSDTSHNIKSVSLNPV